MTQPASGCESVSVTAEVDIVPGPTFTTQPQDDQACVGAVISALSISYTNGSGSPQYQWYNTVNNTTTGTPISGATTDSYTPSTAVAGTTYYYCTVDLPQGGCNTIYSNTAEIIIYLDPLVDLQPISSQTICVGGSSQQLDVSYINGVGTATYQWYDDTVNNNSGGTLIAGATSSSYTPPVFNTIGSYYYYCEITLSGNGCDVAVSNTAEIIVVDDPTVSAPSPSYQQLCQNAIIQDISIVASNGSGSTYTYQWYENINNNTGGTLIAGATNSSYTPQNTVGITYYYCVVTQPASGCESVSVTAEVDIVPGPTFNTQPQDDQACVGAVISALIYLTNGSGSPQYQWYEIRLIILLLVLLFQERLLIVIRLVQLLLVLPIITVLLIYHRVDVILFIPIQPRLLFI